jgi:hypothetical protein
MTDPASIRCKNPGAMWGRVGSKPKTFFVTPEGQHGCDTNAELPMKWGSVKTIYLSDGLGQDNNIAIFATAVQGAAAQFDLWRTSKNYSNRKLADAIYTWSGKNSAESYIAFLIARVPGLTRNTVITNGFLAGPSGIAFVKAQAWHEAGKVYPMTDAEWQQAQAMVFKSTQPVVIAKAEPPSITNPAKGSLGAWIASFFRKA